MTPTLDLPPGDEWGRIFAFNDKWKRRAVANKETAKRLAEFTLPEGTEGKVVIEGFPGALAIVYRVIHPANAGLRPWTILERTSCSSKRQVEETDSTGRRTTLPPMARGMRNGL